MKLVSHAPCERYNVIPARIVVEQRWDETVACKNDDTIVSAAAPASIVEGGILGNELVIEATCDKFIDHLPIERQCARWAQAGAHISPATLGRSVAAHIDLLNQSVTPSSNKRGVQVTSLPTPPVSPSWIRPRFARGGDAGV